MFMSEKQRLYLDGYLSLGLTKTDEVLSLLESLEMGDIKEGFSLLKKYDGTDDLRPSAHEYNKAFLTFLFENDLSKKINLLTGKNMVLHHIQVRRFFKGSSYMPWHRDSYLIDDRSVGNIPPAYKMIFYPKFNNMSTERLSVLRGSHNMFPPPIHSSDFISPGFSKFDKQLFNILKTDEIHSDNSKILLFDTSLLHNVISNNDDRPNTRLIYSFLERDQITDGMLSPPHDRIVSDYLNFES